METKLPKNLYVYVREYNHGELAIFASTGMIGEEFGKDVSAIMPARYKLELKDISGFVPIWSMVKEEEEESSSIKHILKG